MAETNSTQPSAEPVDRAKSKQPRQTRKRRNFATEFADLQGRVETAVRLLQRAYAGSGQLSNESSKELVAVAIETLRGQS